MTVIDIGSAAIDRTSNFGSTYTRIAINNPANATGKLTSIEIWANTNQTGVVVGTLSGSGTSYTPRDSEYLGAVTAGSKQTFSGLNIDVSSGDYIGYYDATGGIEQGTGSGHYYKSGNQFAAGTQTYTLAAGYDFSLYGTGSDVVGWTHIAKVNGVSAASIAKMNGVAVASIAKVNGVAV
ncbi:MAG: hypothetical protein WC455_28180 [Dehalococcoidia bacterium]|jgi:hypothetical protein